jgi:hypothetical protein
MRNPSADIACAPITAPHSLTRTVHPIQLAESQERDCAIIEADSLARIPKLTTANHKIIHNPYQKRRDSVKVFASIGHSHVQGCDTCSIDVRRAVAAWVCAQKIKF